MSERLESIKVYSTTGILLIINELPAKNKTLLTYSFGGGTFLVDRSLISL